MKIDQDPTEDLKKQINQLIAQIKQGNKEYPLQKLTGHFEPGYIYMPIPRYTNDCKIHRSDQLFRKWVQLRMNYLSTLMK